MENNPPEKELQKDFGNGVKVFADTSSHPFTVATFDGDEQVSEEIAAMQAEDMMWFAEGYAKGKRRYEEDDGDSM